MTMKKGFLPKLQQLSIELAHAYGTDKQIEGFEAWLDCGRSQTKAAKKVGVALPTLHHRLTGLVDRIERQGWAPENNLTFPVAPTHQLVGNSIYINKDGEVGGQWIKSKPGDINDEEVRQAILDGIKDGLCDPVEPTRKPPESETYDDILTVFPMGDPHLGMYSWAAEAGEDFDTEIARKDLITATHRLVQCAPASQHALIINLGDFFHADNNENRTSRSGNALDVDTRMSRVWAIGISAMVECINACLKKHQHVTVRNEIGNHDDHASIMLSLALNETYRNEPRVTIDCSPAKFFYYLFGKCLIGTTHGDTVRLPKLPGIMACDQAQAWGRTVHRYWYTGHYHSSKVEEYPGVVVEQFRTLAAKDAWTHGAGYRAGRDMRCIVMHKEHGEIERHRVDITMLRAIHHEQAKVMPEGHNEED
jgi:hypothetical protein